MNLLKIIYQKLYYGFWDFVLPRTNSKIPDLLGNTKNIFIYFDYEREFSGHQTSITDNDIKYILKVLQQQSIITSWFTVGKLFKKYPETIEDIVKNGHEIGSHTFNHIAPFEVSKKRLSDDFIEVNGFPLKGISIQGFHSPRGRWAYKMFKYLLTYEYKYDLIGQRRNKPFTPFVQWVWPNKQIFRMLTVGDDWPLYRDKVKDKSVALNYFKGLSDTVKKGEVAGIGFHPWILCSDNNILEAFKEFLVYLKNEKDVMLETADFYYREINKKPMA